MIFAYFRLLRRRERQWRRRNAPSSFDNLNPKSAEIKCPRCESPWPSSYEPRSHRELMWKGVVCPNCGCEYDRLGRERR